jgi:hypothetical protein
MLAKCTVANSEATIVHSQRVASEWTDCPELWCKIHTVRNSQPTHMNIVVCAAMDPHYVATAACDHDGRPATKMMLTIRLTLNDDTTKLSAMTNPG